MSEWWAPSTLPELVLVGVSGMSAVLLYLMFVIFWPPRNDNKRK